MNTKIFVAQESNFDDISNFLYNINHQVIEELEKKIKFYMKKSGAFIIQSIVKNDNGEEKTEIIGVALTQVLHWFHYHEHIVWIEDIFLTGENEQEEKQHGEFLLDHIKKIYISLHPGIKLFIGNVKGIKTKTTLLTGLTSLGIFMKN